MRETPKIIELKPKSHRTVFQEYSEAFVVAVILAILIRALLVQAFKIPSESMVPTLLVGDHILVMKFIYGIRIPFTDARWPRFTDPKAGDVVVFTYPKDRTKDFIKRVVAVGGDTVEVRDKKVFVNDKPIRDERAQFYGPKGMGQIPVRGDNMVSFQVAKGPGDNLERVEVPKGGLFVMGDNRDNSHDSRFWGPVPVEDVKGKAFMIYYAHRWKRLFNLIH